MSIVLRLIFDEDYDTLYFEVYHDTFYIGYIRRVARQAQHVGRNEWEAVRTIPRGARGSGIRAAIPVPGVYSKHKAVAALVAAATKGNDNG